MRQIVQVAEHHQLVHLARHLRTWVRIVCSYIRHPMYGGLLAFAFGLAAFTGDEARAALAAALAVILSLKVGIL